MTGDVTSDLPPENVEDYPRPPALVPAAARLRIVLGGVTVADTAAGLRVLETYHAPTYYLPPDAFAEGALVPARGRSFCEWKGQARYFDLTAGGVTATGAAWCYPAPPARYAALAGHVAVYPGAVAACYVGATRVTPQPGDFYGGWVTPNLAGRIKGAPGTGGW